jgi:hypothetical protein
LGVGLNEAAAASRSSRPVLTNPVHLDVKSAAQASDRWQLTRSGVLDERISAKALIGSWILS